MQPQLFNFKGKQVRTVTIDNDPYFVGKDIADILGYSQTAKAVREHVPDQFKGVSKLDTPGGKQKVTVISEPGVYKLAFTSKLPTADEFTNWIASEALPAIRKHGVYMTPEKIEEVLLNPDTIITLATQLKQEREGRLIAEQKVNELTPKATYYDKVLADKSLVSITQIAKDYGMSGRAMNKKLHDMKVIYKQGKTWLLYSKYQKTGWTHSETVMVPKKDGSETAILNTKWTQKGRLGLYELLKNHDILPLIEQE